MYWNNKQLQQRTLTIRTAHVCQYHSVSVWYNGTQCSIEQLMNSADSHYSDIVNCTDGL